MKVGFWRILLDNWTASPGHLRVSWVQCSLETIDCFVLCLESEAFICPQLRSCGVLLNWKFQMRSLCAG